MGDKFIFILIELGGKLVICNLQKTPYYDMADLNIRAPCDVLMQGIMEKLGLEIEEWVLRRKIVISIKYKRDMDNNVEAYVIHSLLLSINYYYTLVLFFYDF